MQSELHWFDRCSGPHVAFLCWMRTLARTPHKTDLADLSARKRMSSGELPGLQNRRAAPLVSPVRSTRTRFRHLKPAWLLKIRTLVPFAVLDGSV